MVHANPAAVPSRAPLVRLAAASIAESAAVRAVVSGVPAGLVVVVRFRVVGAPGSAADGCDATASVRVRGETPRLRLALAPRGVWCAGTGELRVIAVRRGARAGLARLEVRPAAAFGQGDVVGQLLLGPTCPVERANDPCDPVAHPDPVALVALDGSGAEAARTTTLADGSFALDLRAGSYTLHADRSTGAYPSVRDVSVVVRSDATPLHPQLVLVSGDTGIR